VTLRDYRAEDFAALCEIDRLCFPPGIAYSPEEIAMAVEQPAMIVVVAEDAGKVAGFVVADPVGRRRGHVITIDVLAQYRQSGLGTRLMEETHRRLLATGTRHVILETAVDNTAAIRFYEKLGYTTVRRLKGYYHGRLDAWQMAKEL
jgi:ribosomal protein S18 acetylase RimI-like enzyme